MKRTSEYKQRSTRPRVEMVEGIPLDDRMVHLPPPINIFKHNKLRASSLARDGEFLPLTGAGRFAVFFVHAGNGYTPSGNQYR